MFSKALQPGDRVIFSAIKHTSHPSPRAKDVRPEPNGEGYLYHVDKFWIVTEKREDQVFLLTRRGKVRVLGADDPRLHVASWWERLVYRKRFPQANPIRTSNGVHA
jgi:hypothetical protein